MTPRPMNLLTDTSENDTVDDLSSDTLKRLAETPASELSVRMSHHNCWAKRWIKSFRIWLAVGFGIAIAVQVCGVVVVHLFLQQMDSRTAATVRATVEEVLKAHDLAVIDPKELRAFFAQDNHFTATTGRTTQ